MSLRIFPISGGARYTNDYAEPRSGGRSHQGNDLFNEEGTPLVAVDDGDIRFGTDPLGGNVANLRSPDGTRYYYAHLSGFEGQNRQVRAGEVIGYLGKTGNAATTAPHLHFEVHPGGGGAVNPFSYLQSAQTTSASKPGGLFWPVIIASAIGFGAWAYMRPASAKRLVRRFT